MAWRDYLYNSICLGIFTLIVIIYYLIHLKYLGTNYVIHFHLLLIFLGIVSTGLLVYSLGIIFFEKKTKRNIVLFFAWVLLTIVITLFFEFILFNIHEFFSNNRIIAYAY